jgi:hypothetical protein
MKFDNSTNNVSVSLGTIGTALETKTHTVTLENVPIQTWVNITATVNNRSLDLYLDGKLVETSILPYLPTQSTAGIPLVVGGAAARDGEAAVGTFDGYISNFQYYARAIDPREAYAIYREGPGGSNWFGNFLSKYKIKLAFLNNNIEVADFEL